MSDEGRTLVAAELLVALDLAVTVVVVDFVVRLGVHRGQLGVGPLKRVEERNEVGHDDRCHLGERVRMLEKESTQTEHGEFAVVYPARRCLSTTTHPRKQSVSSSQSLTTCCTMSTRLPVACCAWRMTAIALTGSM